MKYSASNKPKQCFMTQSTWYKGAGTVNVKGILWHSTGANNPNLKRYVQPDDNAADRDTWLAQLGTNTGKNDWNHISLQAGVNAFIGKLADETITTIQVGPWDKKAWGCGSGSLGSCNNGWVQFEICEDDLTNKQYFDAVYKEACELTAYLCNLYGLNPQGTINCNGVEVPVILCHADSCALKLGSNHADVLHWFKKFNKTMDDVRADVAKLLPTQTLKGGSSMGFTPRTTRPTSGNKYYIRKASGGYSNAIAGKCKSTGKPDPQCDVLANCVGYAYGRFNEIGNYGSCKYLSPVNAENFPEYAKGLTLGAEPKLGAVIVWKKGATLKGDDGAGHVAIVEKINSDGSILISQSGYNSNPFWTETIKKGDGNWRPTWMGTAYTFRCFIYNPAVKDSDNTITKVSPRKGCTGADVKALQKQLNILGYKLDVDGSFGAATETAVKDFQTKNKLSVDGIVGPATQSAIDAAVKTATTKPAGVIDLKLLLDGKTVTAWGIVNNGTNYIRLRDLETLDIVKSVSWNSTQKLPEVKTK